MGHAPERSDARANRQKILDAAVEVIAERGGSAEVKDVAERAGVGVGTIYRNFATRDDLFRAVVEETLQRLYAVRDEALALDDPAESIGVYVRGMFHILERWSPALSAMIAGAFTEEMKDRFIEFTSDQRLEAIFHRGIALGVFRKDIPVALARGFLVSTCDPLTYLALRASATPEEMAAGYTDLIMRALRA